MLTDSKLMQRAIEDVAKELYEETWVGELMTWEDVPATVREHLRMRARTIIGVLQNLGFGFTNYDIRARIREHTKAMRGTLNMLEQDTR